MVGGALGLAILATLATSRTASDLRHPTPAVHTLDQALVSGFTHAFLFAGLMAFAGAAAAIFAMPSRIRRTGTRAPVAEPQAAVPVEV
jgi:hypothetical protein